MLEDARMSKTDSQIYRCCLVFNTTYKGVSLCVPILTSKAIA